MENYGLASNRVRIRAELHQTRAFNQGEFRLKHFFFFFFFVQNWMPVKSKRRKLEEPSGVATRPSVDTVGSSSRALGFTK